ncbi:MAG TPA: alpha/beta hydrolase family protein [Clostridia bacterium]|nr:alpha/beta hydrolase family protein [Clostridia bacterium]
MGASVINCKFSSNLLYYQDECNVILPSLAKPEDLKVLYLLHGMHGTCHDWITYTNIVRLAENYRVAVVCPNAKNSFYADMRYGEPFYTYLTTEFMEYVQRTFGFSAKRKDNIIAGLSMGGYGALKIAFNNPDKFCIAGSFSGVLDMANIKGFVTGDEQTDRKNMQLFISIFGEDPVLLGTDNDLISLVQRNKTVNGYSVKDLLVYQYCGTSDFLSLHNMSFKKCAEEAKLNLKYATDGGSHDWERWDEQIALFLQEYFG